MSDKVNAETSINKELSIQNSEVFDKQINNSCNNINLYFGSIPAADKVYKIDDNFNNINFQSKISTDLNIGSKRLLR